MTADQAVAAYQMLATIEKVAPQKEAREVAKALKEAAASQMSNLVLKDVFTHNRVRMKARFREIGVRITAPDNPY
jgi:type III secretory pathway component EscT